MALTRSVMVTPAAWSKRQVGHHVILRHLAALHPHRAHAGHAVQRRLQIVGGNLPQPGLRNGIGCEAVAEDGEGGEGKPVGGDTRRRRQALRRLGQRRIHQLQRLDHVHVPVEEKAHFRRAAAGGRSHGEQARTVFTASSMGRVTVTSICSTGITPLSTPITTRGKFVSVLYQRVPPDDELRRIFRKEGHAFRYHLPRRSKGGICAVRRGW